MEDQRDPIDSGFSDMDFTSWSTKGSLHSRPCEDSPRIAFPDLHQLEHAILHDSADYLQECQNQLLAEHSTQHHSEYPWPLQQAPVVHWKPPHCSSHHLLPMPDESAQVRSTETVFEGLPSLVGLDAWESGLDSLATSSEMPNVIHCGSPDVSCQSPAEMKQSMDLVHCTSEAEPAVGTEDLQHACSASLSSRDSACAASLVVADYQLPCSPPLPDQSSLPESSRHDQSKMAAAKPKGHRGRGRPRIYNTSVVATIGGRPDALTDPARKRRGAKPKYRYTTEAEALAMRRERNRNTAINSYYQRKAHIEQLQQEIDDLQREQDALQELDDLSQSKFVDKGRLREILEETRSGVQTLELISKGQ